MVLDDLSVIEGVPDSGDWTVDLSSLPGHSAFAFRVDEVAGDHFQRTRVRSPPPRQAQASLIACA